MKTRRFLKTPDESAETDSLRLEVGVVPSEACSCPLRQASEDGRAVEEVRRTSTDGRCVSEVVVSGERGETEVLRSETGLENDCICPVFEESGIVPSVEGAQAGEVVVSAYLAEDGVEEVLDEVREKADDVRAIGMRRVGEREAEADISELTEKQYETLRRAVVGGYYDDPQRISLEELAEEFGVSKSAVSQRLRRAESKIVIEAFE